MPREFSCRNTPASKSWPSTNVGNDRPMSTPTVADRSNRERALVALRMPTDRPTTSQITTPPTSTEAVRGMSCDTIVLTGSPPL